MRENIPLQPGEEIKSIQGYEDLYSITSFGRVWSHPKQQGFRWREGSFLKPRFNVSNGTFEYQLHMDGKVKHFKRNRLIAQAFIPNPNNLPEVIHKDGDITNDFIDNLKWSDTQGNHNNAIVNGSYDYKRISKYYGVRYHFLNEKWYPWYVSIRINGKYKRIGSCRTEIEAAQLYNTYVIKHNIDRPLNKIDLKTYLIAVKKSKELRNKTTDFIGVRLRKHLKKNPWEAYLTFENKRKYIGMYPTALKAAKARDTYVLKHKLNLSINNVLME